MKTFCPLFFLVCSWLQIQAQDVSRTLIYRLTTAEAEQLYAAEHTPEIEEQYFHSLIDSFVQQYDPHRLDLGHYLFVKAGWERLLLEVRSFYSFDLQLLNNDRDLAIQVVDSSGQLHPDASLRFRSRPVLFDEKTRTYRLRTWKKGGLLKVELGGETAFFEVTPSQKPNMGRKRLRRFTSTKVGKVISLPFRVAEGVYVFFRNGIGHGHWRLPFRGKNRSFKGYMAFNKPRYRPGDTVQVKAFVANHKGKPWKKPLKVQLSSRNFEDDLETSLYPLSPGAFVYQLVAADSLRIDQRYRLSFSKPRDKWRRQLTHSFYLEDYQLDETSYLLESEKKEYKEGEPILLRAEGKDANRLSLAGAKASIVVTTVSVSEYHARETLVPDTLWVHELDLRSDGPTQFAVPDSIFPPVSLRFNVKAYFEDVTGETQQEQLQINYLQLTEQIETKLEEGFLLATYYENGQERSAEGLLKTTLAGRQQLDTIRFPLRYPVNAQASGYLLEAGEARSSINLRSAGRDANDDLIASGRRPPDSVFLSIRNPHRILVTYQVLTKSGEVARGSFETAEWAWQCEDRSRAAYFLRYQYSWGGEVHQKEEQVRFYKNELNIRLEEPERIRPGETVQIAVEVTDAKGRKVAGADLAAGAVNAQFGGLSNLKSPQIPYRVVKEPLEYVDFSKSKLVRKDFRQDLSRHWYDRLDLRSDLFYRLRYEGDGVYMEYDTLGRDTFYQKVAQFAPYIVSRGKAEPIYLIYCNRRLVYYYGVDGDPPYAFPGREGENRITVRTRNFEYTLEGVYLKKGQKLEIAIDEDRFGASGKASFITRRSVPPELNNQEKTLLRASLFALKNNSRDTQYVWDSDWNIHIISGTDGRAPFLLGPFQQNAWLKYQEQGGQGAQFRFESGFDYLIGTDRDKLYANDRFPYKRKMPLPESPPLKRPGQQLYKPSIIKTKGEQKRIFGTLWYSYDRHLPNTGNYAFRYPYPKEGEEPLGLVLEKEDSICGYFFPNVRQLNDLTPGNYALYYFLSSGDYLQQQFRIRADTLLFQDLSGRDLIRDSSQVKLWEFIEKNPGRRPPTRYHYQDGVRLQGNRVSSTNGPFRGGPGIISGRVVDETTGEPLIGASIIVKGTSTGTVTDIDGYYELRAPAGGSELIISYTGFNTQEISLNDVHFNFDVELSLSHESLSEVVVTGLGISSARIRDLPTRDISALAGATAGLTVTDEGLLEKDILPEEEAFSGTDLRTIFRDYGWWQPHLLTDRDGKAYFTVTYPEDITAWRTFALGMDRQGRGGAATGLTRSFKELAARLSLPRFMVEGDRAEITGRSLNYGADTIDIYTWFRIENARQAALPHRIADAVVESYTLEAPADTDSLTVAYALEQGAYLDGEERSIPVFPKGTLETKGGFYLLEGDTSLMLDFEPEYGPVHIHAQENLLEVLLKDIEYLKTYPYGCNEQTASRLLALLMDKEIRQLLELPWEGEQDIIKMIVRLEKAQNPDGSWGWWAGNTSNMWMAGHVLRALSEAERAGYRTAALEFGLRLLSSRLEELKGKELLNALELLSGLEQNVDYAALLAPFDSLELSLYDQLLTTKIRQVNGLDYQLDSLFKYRKQTIFGAHYWGEEAYRWYDNSVQLSLLVYQILKREGREEELKRIRQYFLEQRCRTPVGRAAGWRNTFETARILKTLLPDWLAQTEAVAGEGAKNELRVSAMPGEAIRSFPYSGILEGIESLRIEKAGGAPLYLTTYQQFQNRDPAPSGDLFTVMTRLEQNGRKTNSLVKGEKALMIIDVAVKASADFVMIEAPIPAGCSYHAKPNRYRIPEVHREYFRQHTAIFCERLPEGRYTFTIELEPRFSGVYTLNPAKVEQMYFPVFFGRNGMGKVEIKSEKD